MSDSVLRVRYLDAAQDRQRALVTMTSKGVTFAADLTLDEARCVARQLAIPLPADEATHTLEALNFAIESYCVRLSEGD